MLFNYIKKLNFIENATRYKVLTNTISKGKQKDPKSFVQQIANSIKTFYYRRFSDAAVTECDYVVTYNLITSKVIFKNLVRNHYLIVALTNAPIISLFDHINCSFKIRQSSKQEINLLSVGTKIVRIQLSDPVISFFRLKK